MKIPLFCIQILYAIIIIINNCHFKQKTLTVKCFIIRELLYIF